MPLPSYSMNAGPTLLTGPQNVGDNQQVYQRGGDSGEGIVQTLYGQYTELVKRGMVFAYNTAAAGVTLIAPAAATNMPAVWNPTGSGKNFIPLYLTINWVSGPDVAGYAQLSFLNGCGAALGAGLPIATFTQAAAINLLLGAGNASVMRFSPVVNTTTVAPALLMGLGISAWVGAGATATAPMWISKVGLEGSLVVPPGSAIWFHWNVVSTTIAMISIVGAEVPQ